MENIITESSFKMMDEKLYRELGQLTNDKTLWKQNIPQAGQLAGLSGGRKNCEYGDLRNI